MKLIAVLSLCVLFSAVGFGQTGLRVGSPAPEFTATDMKGDNLALSDLRGKVVVITFWTTRCPICHEEFPKLNQVIKSFDANKVVFLSLTTDNEEKVENYVRKTPLGARVLPNSFGILLQYADRDRAGNLDMGYPAFFVINAQGNIQYRSSGYDKTESLSSTLSKLLSTM